VYFLLFKFNTAEIYVETPNEHRERKIQSHHHIVENILAGYFIESMRVHLKTLLDCIPK